MEKTVKIWEYLANKFDNESLADEILRFFVEINCNYDNFKNFVCYPFKISFPGLVVRLDNNNWKTELENCLSIRCICNLDASQIEYVGAIAIIKALKTNSTLQEINLGII